MAASIHFLDANVIAQNATAAAAAGGGLDVWNSNTCDGTDEEEQVPFNLDITKAQIMFIDFTWLGFGHVRMGFQTGVDFTIAHEFVFTNLVTVPHLSNPSLPLRHEIENTGTAPTAASLIQVCGAVFSEGGSSPRLYNFAADTEAVTAITTVDTPILSIRLKAAYNRLTVSILDAYIVATTNDSIHYHLVLNGVLGGTPSWVSADDESAIEHDSAATSITGGRKLFVGGISNQGRSGETKLSKAFRIASNIAGTSDVLTLTAATITGGASVYGGMNWQEVR